MSDIRLGSYGVAHRREPVVIERQGEGFYSVLAGSAGRVLLTNELGRAVLELCDGERDAAEIATTISARYSHVPSETVETDVLSFLEQATEKEVITWSS